MFLNKKISVLFLVHNEVTTIEEDIINIKNSLDGFINYEIIIVQDGSTDGTYEKLEIIKERYNIKLNSIKNRRGYTQAFLDGIEDCNEKIIFFSDTGGKYDFKNIKKFLIKFFDENIDFLSGYRINRKDKYYRKILTLFYSTLINLLFLKNFKDYDCGFKIFKKDLLKEIIAKKEFTPYLLTSQIFIFFFIFNFKVSQLPIEYLEDKNRFSRGLPLKRIPKVIYLSIQNILKIRLKLK
jgi:glycosyltransferase involved in cell wall biosynthesis